MSEQKSRLALSQDVIPLLQALGVDTKYARSCTIFIEASSAVSIVVERYVTTEQIDGVVHAVGGYQALERARSSSTEEPHIERVEYNLAMKDDPVV